LPAASRPAENSSLAQIFTAGFPKEERFNIIDMRHGELCLTVRPPLLGQNICDAREIDLRFCSLLLSAVLLFAGGIASAQTLSASGVAGYLSEWQLNAELSPAAASGEFTGPLSIKHVGLCTHDGPDEIITQLNLRMSDAKPWLAKARSEIKATFVMDGSECTLTGSFSGSYRGSMDCGSAKGVPIEITVK
jgi:hypothetical protein